MRSTLIVTANAGALTAGEVVGVKKYSQLLDLNKHAVPAMRIWNLSPRRRFRSVLAGIWLGVRHTCLFLRGSLCSCYSTKNNPHAPPFPIPHSLSPQFQRMLEWKLLH